MSAGVERTLASKNVTMFPMQRALLIPAPGSHVSHVAHVAQVAHRARMMGVAAWLAASLVGAACASTSTSLAPAPDELAPLQTEPAPARFLLTYRVAYEDGAIVRH